MRFSGDIKKRLDLAHDEMRVLLRFMKLNGFGSMNYYRNPETAKLTPGVTYAERIALLIGYISALEFSLNRKESHEKKK